MKDHSCDGKCVVFTHLTAGGRRADRLAGEWYETIRAYQGCESVVGKVFIFVSEGWQALLDVQKSRPPFVQLTNDRELVAMLKHAAKEAKCRDGFIVPIGFDDTVNVLSRLQRYAEAHEYDIRPLFLGAGKYMRYDSPKVVDAILRITGRNTGCPVFRIDGDVNPDEASFAKLLEAYRNLPDRGHSGVYVFSGGYGGWDYSTQPQEAMRNNYAVRTAHLADPATDRLDPELCEKFMDSISKIGAEQGFSLDRNGGNVPHAQVISGAGFCLSYGAIRRLPPFSNAAYQITWIDDHLKRKLHEAIDDLGDNAGTSRVVDALFKQERQDVLAVDKVSGYLMTLARGCIFDALIHSGNRPGLYAKCVKSFREGTAEFPRIFKKETKTIGDFKVQLLSDLGLELAEIGRRRIEQVRELWGEALSGKELGEDKSFVPRRDMPDSFLLPPRLKGNLVENAENCRVYEVLQDAEQYFHLLKVWPIFHTLLVDITRGDDWLFDRPDSMGSNEWLA
jgi:hypothetical protein